MFTERVPAPIRILVVDDEPLFVDALMHFLADEERTEVVGVARDGEEGMALALELEPDIVLMDKTMPRLGGIEATRRIRDALPGACILILTSSGSPADMGAAAEAGASGFLTKDSLSTELIGVILDLASIATKRI